nr:PREDICTED: 39S ribosomal protein L2, mitochondrial [Bemisia tabaci]
MNPVAQTLRLLQPKIYNSHVQLPQILNFNKIVVTCVRNWNHTHLDLADKHRLKKSRYYKREVHFPEKYTVKPIPYTNLGGRDPETGRVVVKGLGGGIKHKYHWIDWYRVGPKDDSPPTIEKVLKIIKSGLRTADIALVGVEGRLKYIVASANMKAGDLLKTSMFIPRIPVAAEEGDAYPIGALTLGTVIHNLEMYPEKGAAFCKAAGSFATITRKIGDRVIVQLPSKHELSLDPHCMATVGRVSNLQHASTDLGTIGWREAGNRPRSGLWQRKGGRFGLKIKPPPPIKYIEPPKDEYKPKEIVFSCDKPHGWFGLFPWS